MSQTFWAIQCPLFLALFLSSCRTQPAGYQAVAKESETMAWLQGWSANCMKSGKGFLEGYIGFTGVPDLRLEGVWENGFQNFTGAVLSPLGDELVRLEAKGHAVRVETSAPEVSIQEFTQVVSALGSLGLRRVLCGTFAFPVEGEYQVFRQTEAVAPVSLPSSSAVYFVQSTFSTPQGTARLKTDMLFSGQTSSVTARLSSQISGGIFSRQEIGHLDWEGSVHELRSQPQRIRFRSVETGFSLVVEDFE